MTCFNGNYSGEEGEDTRYANRNEHTDGTDAEIVAKYRADVNIVNAHKQIIKRVLYI